MGGLPVSDRIDEALKRLDEFAGGAPGFLRKKARVDLSALRAEVARLDPELGVWCFWNNCPINEQTGDGRTVGRCWFYLHDGKTCERHGDVSEAAKVYRRSGMLTLENDHRAAREGKT